MRSVLEAIDRKTGEYAAHPLYEFLRDPTIDMRQRLAFVPAVSHFVMTFSDLRALVLREEPARDRIQEIVNAHTREDDDHWKWFLADLGQMGHDPHLPFSSAIEFLWSGATAKTRLLSYQLCRLSLGADSFHKLVVVHCVEATFKVSLQSVTPVARQFAETTGKKLLYFGAHHADAEASHALDEDTMRRMVADIEIAPDLERELVTLVDTCFAHFSAFADELLAFAKSGRRIGAS